jgi:hypothetical protein
MNIENWQRLRKIFKKIFRIQGIFCFVIGIKSLVYLHWDTYWYALKFILFGLLYLNYDKLWSLVEQKWYQERQ